MFVESHICEQRADVGHPGLVSCRCLWIRPSANCTRSHSTRLLHPSEQARRGPRNSARSGLVVGLPGLATARNAGPVYNFECWRNQRASESQAEYLITIAKDNPG